ncbi:MAG: translation elongation factor Ts [Thermoguttaceae bacterium]|jgi:elongation factor Ts|nr:translation elongation factor Ts [Thermoguttaceae bacterium]
MAEITAAAVKSLRERTGLPMMDCKRALEQAGGDPEAAIEILRKAGKKTMEKRSGRETSFGRVFVKASIAPPVGAMVELRCESAPVANNEEFLQLGRDLVERMAMEPAAITPDDLLGRPSPSKPGQTLREQLDDLSNRIREVFRVTRVVRLDGPCGGYAHHSGTSGVLLQIDGGDGELAKDICMHIAAMRPLVVSRDQLDPAAIDKERQILSEQARQEGKPEKIIAKMIEGRMKDFYAERCLAEQPHVNKEKYHNETVAKLSEKAGMKLVRFVLWELGKE